MSKFQKVFEKYIIEAGYYKKGLTEIPKDVAGKSINGNFDIGNNKLSSLNGGPKSVSGHYSANNNDLTSLAGAPLSADRFSIDNNAQLGSLSGISDNKYNTFTCANCGLKNLNGLPIVKGALDVSNNPLESLSGLEKNKKYNRIQVTGTKFNYKDVQEYCDKHGIKCSKIDD